jgi:alpha-N-acetylglucosaminidase
MRAAWVLCFALVTVVQCDDPLQPARDLLVRLVGPSTATNFQLAINDDACKSSDCASLANADNGNVLITGSNVNSLTFGIGTYVKRYCNASLTWTKTGGMDRAKTACASALEVTPLVIRRAVKWTYYQNVVMSSYSFVWWDWARWEIELDWMALHGINLALMYTGQEAVLARTYKRFGVDLYNQTGTGAFFNGPAFLSWSRGQGMADVGGFDQFTNRSDGALPSWWLDGQEALGKLIATRMRALGVKTILRGFEGALHTTTPHTALYSQHPHIILGLKRQRPD